MYANKHVLIFKIRENERNKNKSNKKYYKIQKDKGKRNIQTRDSKNLRFMINSKNSTMINKCNIS